MLLQEEKKYMINTYDRKMESTPFLVRGSGTRVFDYQGKEYLDFVGGLAVNALGHCHPAVVQAAREQLGRLIHASNLYYTEPQIVLARCLVENTPADRVFFCNSGAEANEAAIKIARRYGKINKNEQAVEIITAYNSFHGRTLATLTATGQEKVQKGFAPLLPGFRYALFNNLESFRLLLNSNTCAIMIEPVQGEGGVYVGSREFITGLRQLCDEHGVLLIFDEVQCGLGRTGKLLAAEHFGVEADIFTLAKALGGGLPIGAMLCKERVAEAFSPGDHASTFGGNPVACAAAVAVLGEILSDGFLRNTEITAAILWKELLALKEEYPLLIKEVRGLGMILGIELNGDAQAVQRHCAARGLLVNCVAVNVLRLLPPLNVKREEIYSATSILKESLSQLI